MFTPPESENSADDPNKEEGDDEMCISQKPKNAVLHPFVRLSVCTVTHSAGQNPEKKTAPDPDPVVQGTEKNFQFFHFARTLSQIVFLLKK